MVLVDSSYFIPVKVTGKGSIEMYTLLAFQHYQD